MPTPKMTVANFLDHGIVAAPAATRVLDEDDSVSFAAVQPSASETTKLVMAKSKTLNVAEVKKNPLASVIIGASSPLQLATALIKARYDLLDGQSGFLGAPQNAVTACPDGVGFFRHYAGGSIYWSPRTGAHEVHGLIRQKWAGMGWERSFLGYPRTDEKKGKDDKQEGRVSVFEGGHVYYHPASGTFEVHGAILAKYLEIGAEASVLGYPATDETATPDKIGRFNHFQRGSIYWTPSTWAHEVHGLIRNWWAQHGWERNPQIGYPLTDELVPHRSVGQIPAPLLDKPFDRPVDVLKLPPEQKPPHLVVVGTATLETKPKSQAIVVKRTAAAPKKTAATTSIASKVGKASDSKSSLQIVKLGTTDKLVAQPVLTIDPSILINDHKGRSDDRYADFENGVLFWRRKTNEVTSIAPRAKSPQGTKVTFTAAEMTGILGARVRAALMSVPNSTIGAASLAGTTAYSFDGAGVHNRAHRIKVGVGSTLAAPNAISASIEARFEVSLDPIDREIVAYLVSWSPVLMSGNLNRADTLRTQLHARLDPLLWKQFLITRVTATAANPIAILSVKTLQDGSVGTYFEP